MRANWTMTLLLGLVVGLFAGIGTAITQTAPTADERQALSPTGKLRVGFLLNNPVHATKDPVSGELRGVSIDIGKEFARRIGVPYDGVGYASIPALEASAQSGQWDILVFGANSERAKLMDFSPAFMEVEVGYLVPAGSSISALSDVDKPGIRIAVTEKGAVDAYLSASLKSAILLRAPIGTDSAELLASGKVDTYASLKPFLFRASERMPGSRVLEGRIFAERIAIAVPKGRDVSMAYVRRFIEDVKSIGFVKESIDRAGLRGVVLAP
jgi:polar amino acid transport system substrate-binding protein